MRNATRAAGLPAGGFPRFREADDPTRLLLATTSLRDQPGEHPRDDMPHLLQPFMFDVLCLKQRAQVRGDRETRGSSFFVVYASSRTSPASK